MNRMSARLLLVLPLLCLFAAPPSAAEQDQAFKGRPISLDVRDAPLEDIFRLFEKVSGKEIVLDDPEIGRRVISIDVDSMPWDQILDFIRRTHHLRVHEESEILHIEGPDWIETEGLAHGDLLLETALFRGVREKPSGVTTQVLPIGGPFLVIDSEWVRDLTQQERMLQETFGLSAVGVLAAPKILMRPSEGENGATITTTGEQVTTLLRFRAWPVGEGDPAKVRVRAELTYDGVPFETEVIATPGKPFMLGGRIDRTGDYVFLSVTPWLNRGPDLATLKTVRVGTEGLEQLEKRRSISPAYPRRLQEQGKEGRAVLDVVVAEDGRIAEVKVLDATNMRFARAAEDAVWQWRYEPPRVDGKPVRAAMVVKIDFSLPREEGVKDPTSPGSSE